MFVKYEPRPLSYIGTEATGGFRLKVYAICYESQTLDSSRFAGGWALAEAALPQPAVTAGRLGVGFVIQHQGRTGDYLILSWWDNENELPTRVFQNSSGEWLPASGGESFCVWDLRVIWWEREAYVATVLAGRAEAEKAYLAAVVEGYA